MCYLVKNISGTTDRECQKCSSWLKHWEKLTGKTAKYCSKCAEQATLGGHVRKIFSDKKEYITPLCHKCNSYDENFYACQDLVRAVKCD